MLFGFVKRTPYRPGVSYFVGNCLLFFPFTVVISQSSLFCFSPFLVTEKANSLLTFRHSRQTVSCFSAAFHHRLLTFLRYIHSRIYVSKLFFSSLHLPRGIHRLRTIRPTYSAQFDLLYPLRCGTVLADLPRSGSPLWKIPILSHSVSVVTRHYLQLFSRPLKLPA